MPHNQDDDVLWIIVIIYKLTQVFKFFKIQKTTAFNTIVFELNSTINYTENSLFYY